MKTQTFAFLHTIVATLTLGCGGAPERHRVPDTVPLYSTDNNVGGAEHCLNENLCFLETDRGGKSGFFIDQTYYNQMMLDPGFGALGVELSKVKPAEYTAMIKSTAAVRVTYGPTLDIYQNKFLASDAKANARLREKKGGLFKTGFGALGSIFNVAVTLMNVSTYKEALAPLAKAMTGRGTDAALIPVVYHPGEESVPDMIPKPARKKKH